MTPGALILSSVFHGTLLAGAVYASGGPSEESWEAVELVSFRDGVKVSGTPPPAEAGPAPRGGIPAVVPPRILANAVIDGEVIADFVVLPNGTVDLATVRILGATHDGFEAATRNVLGQLRFAPGRLNGEPAPVWTRLPIVWSVRGG